MQGFDDGTILPFRNVFTRPFLEKFGEVDEPPTAGEADVAGRWEVEEIPHHGFGLYRTGEGWSRGLQPAAVFARRSVALLAAAVLPGTGRDAAFRLHKDADPSGYAVESAHGIDGHLALFDERLVDALHVVEMIVRSPESLADLLEAAGSLALERAGAILESRFPVA
jgi:hypothetical protein